MRTRFTVLCLPHPTALTHHPLATVASVYRHPATLSACVASSAATSIQRHATSKPTGADQQQQQHGTDAAHPTVFSSSVVLILIFPTPSPSTVAASHSDNSMFAIEAATSVTTSLICNCEMEVVPLQTSHSMPPPPPSFAPARRRRCPSNITSNAATTTTLAPDRKEVVAPRRSHLTLPPP